MFCDSFGIGTKKQKTTPHGPNESLEQEPSIAHHVAIGQQETGTELQVDRQSDEQLDDDSISLGDSTHESIYSSQRQNKASTSSTQNEKNRNAAPLGKIFVVC